MPPVATPLTRLSDLANRPDPSGPAGSGPSSRGLALDVARLCDRLALQISDGPWGSDPGLRPRFLLYAEDSYAFAVGLLAIARNRAIAVIPPNAQAGTLADVMGGVSGALSDRELSGVSALPILSQSPVAGVPVTVPPVAKPSAREIDFELFTSGTTGDAKRIPKTLAQIDAEVEVLEIQFGALLAGAKLVSTVSHQHLYGLLFRLAWPLASGRAFPRHDLKSEAELLAEASRQPIALVSSPAFLDRLRERTWRSLAGRCTAVFSSGGPLQTETAARIRSLLGHAPIEIFGSTETGGVAWRRFRPDGDAEWRNFIGVETAIDAQTQRLEVCSPFVSDPSESTASGSRDRRATFLMGDRAEARPGGFALRGRADRVVKIGEKRVALSDMEARLREHPAVEEVALLKLESGRLGAVVVTTGPPPEKIAERRELGGALREHLAKHWEPLVLPRAWRFLREMPRNSQGKLPSRELRNLFLEPDAPTRPTQPEILRERIDSQRARWSCRVPPDLACLEGHFPGRPVVPGVAILGWAMELAKVWLEGRSPKGVDALKFREMLLPEDLFALTLQKRDARIDFEVVRGRESIASGRILLP